MDPIVLTVCLLFVTVCFIVFMIISFFFDNNYSLHGDNKQAFAIIDVVKALQKACPVGSRSVSKWKLIPICCGPPRCWAQQFSHALLNAKVNLYASVTTVNCSPAHAFSLVGETSLWEEWLPFKSGHYTVQPLCSKALQKDRYMHAHKVTNTNGYATMFRFSYFSKQDVGWTLFWNEKELYFLFFLMQPIISETGRCLVTHMVGTQNVSNVVATAAVQRLRNMKDVIRLSPQIIIPTFSEETYNRERVESVFLLLPLSYATHCTVENLQGFCLTLKDHKKKCHHKKEPTSILRRTLSDLSNYHKSMPTPKTKCRSFTETAVSNQTVHPQKSISTWHHYSDETSSVPEEPQDFYDCRIADFLTRGNYGASELQAQVLQAAESPSGGWTFHSLYKGTEVFKKEAPFGPAKTLSYLCRTEVELPPQDIWKVVRNPRFRFLADETVKTVKILEQLSPSLKLVHAYHEVSGVLWKECLDFCLLHSERKEGNTFYAAFQSIEYSDCPFVDAVNRSFLLPSGWILEEESGSTRVIYVMQVLLSHPDSMFIQELATLVPQSLHNLKNYVIAKPM